MLPLDNLNLRDMQDAGFITQKKKFALFNPDSRWAFEGFVFHSPHFPLHFSYLVHLLSRIMHYMCVLSLYISFSSDDPNAHRKVGCLMLSQNEVHLPLRELVVPAHHYFLSVIESSMDDYDCLRKSRYATVKKKH